MTIKNLLQHLPGLLLLSGLISLTATVTSCFDDDMLDTLKKENTYVDYSNLDQHHKSYFPIPDSGQTTSYTLTQGEDCDNTDLPAQDYTDNGNGTIKDEITGLTWLKCTVKDDNSAYNHATCDPSPNSHGDMLIIEDAVNACENLDFAGYDDWRLPTYPELYSLVYFGSTEAGEPAINTTFFPNTEFTEFTGHDTSAEIFFSLIGNNKFYISSTIIFNEGSIYYVNFFNGLSNVPNEDWLQEPVFFARCVRND